MNCKNAAAVVLGATLMTGTAFAATEPCAPKAPSHFVVIDQFGYTPSMRKIAVVRVPVAGYDAGEKFAPGAVWQVVDAKTCAVVLEGAARPWHSGDVDPSSGDRAWHFDFSALTAPGRYFVRDKSGSEASAVFAVDADPYRPVLIQAMRFFYYQRANVAKTAPFTDPRWTTPADHLGLHQDAEARFLLDKNNAALQRDLHGGWWDAGDLNRYTNWHSDNVLALLNIYVERPEVFTDDFNIPESGNSIPDIIDEAKFGLDWLTRMQNPDGSVLSILGVDSGAGLPSEAKKPSYYGAPSTSASYSAAAAFAYGAKILERLAPFHDYTKDLRSRAEKAWAWAETHPGVTFFNKNPGHGAETLGGGEQEVSTEGCARKALTAAIYLHDLTGDAKYEARLKPLAEATPLLRERKMSGSDGSWLPALLHYASANGAKTELAEKIRLATRDGLRADAIYGAASTQANPYLAYIPRYYWGITAEISRRGAFFLYPDRYGLSGIPADMAGYSADYLHYLHGVNPLGKVYLSNMGAFGAANSVDSFFHSWFFKGTAWSSVKDSAYGPPPGYLVGGPNPSYNWDKRCPQIDPGCGKAPPSPPFGQPPQKSYADFNDSWPLNSWEVTEPDVGYQVEYIRLLAHFVAVPK